MTGMGGARGRGKPGIFRAADLVGSHCAVGGGVGGEEDGGEDVCKDMHLDCLSCQYHKKTSSSLCV
jgi:hypothetical protein